MAGSFSLESHAAKAVVRRFVAVGSWPSVRVRFDATPISEDAEQVEDAEIERLRLGERLLALK